MVDAAKRIALLCLGLVVSLPAGAQTASPAGSADLEKVISQLNAAAAKFESAQADFIWDQLIVAVQDHDLQTGTIYYERKKGGSSTRVAAYLKQDNGKPAPKTVIFDGGDANFYEPGIKQLTVIRAGANKSQWESFLTLGFGGSGTELKVNWKVSLLGTENMDGVPVAKLDLVPVQQSVANMFTHVTIWIDPAKGLSHKQIFYQPSGDLRTATYTNIRYNSPIAADVFQLTLPKGTTRVVK
jgi:outer membrane lipoprotein-sorting protein